MMYGLKYVFRRHILRKKEPFIAGLVLGEHCNLECSHCSFSKKTDASDLSFAEIELGLIRLYAQGIKLLAITGGEPFIWKDGDKTLEDVIALARSIGFLVISVYTNGTKPLNTTADDVFISIDDIVEKNRKLSQKQYETVINNIENSTHQRIIVNCVINKKNKERLEEICDYITSIKQVKGIFFYFHTPYYGKDELYISFEEKKEVIHELLQLKKKYNILNSKATLMDVYYDRWKRPSSICQVYAENKIYQCCRSVGNEDTCRDCGYLGYPEVMNIVNLKPSALLNAFQYLPKRRRKT